MTPAARDWLAGLRRFSEEHRAPRPERRVPVPSDPSTPPPLPESAEEANASAAETRILAAWLADRGRGLVAATLAARPEAAVVLTTTPAGFSAADRLAAALSAVATVGVVTEIEYRGWCMRSPDEAFGLHENIWSWLKKPVPEARRREFARWPLPASHRYWLHRHGRAGALGEWRSADLWQWDGSVATLLAVGVDEIARRPG